MTPNDWITAVSEDIRKQFPLTEESLREILEKHCPLKSDTEVGKEPPLLQCIDCKNTESPAGAMARYFNQGRCLHCGGYFKVVRG